MYRDNVLFSDIHIFHTNFSWSVSSLQSLLQSIINHYVFLQWFGRTIGSAYNSGCLYCDEEPTAIFFIPISYCIQFFFQIHPVIFVSFWERNPSYPQSHLQLRPIYTGSPHCCTAKNAAVFFKQFAFDFTMVIYHAQTALYGQVAEAQDIRSLHREKHKHLRAPYTKPF